MESAYHCTGSCTHAHTQTHTRTHTHTYVHTHVHTLTHAHAHERGEDSRRRGGRGCGPRVWVARAARVWAEAVCGEGVGGEGGEGVGGEVRVEGVGGKSGEGVGGQGVGGEGGEGGEGVGSAASGCDSSLRAHLCSWRKSTHTNSCRPASAAREPSSYTAGRAHAGRAVYARGSSCSKLLENACCTTHASVDSPQMRRRDAQLPDCDDRQRVACAAFPC